MPLDQKHSRRGFLDWVIGCGSAVTAAATTFPALMYLWPAAKGGSKEAVEVEGAKSLSPGKSKMLQVGGKAVIVVRDREGFKAFSAVCTHLGCLVKWDEAHRQFLCPCHAAVFDENGGVVSGPPPAPLPTYQVKEVGDKVFVSAS
ncbi:MAG: Rieske 2Fe-2S domain-containing protein [Planctomycetota bacterium]